MAQKTSLHPSGIPGKKYNFEAKTAVSIVISDPHLALRISHSAGDTDFKWYEMKAMRIKYIQKYDLDYLRKINLPRLKLIGKEFRLISITFLYQRNAEKSIRQKIDEFKNLVDYYNQPEIMILYYRKLIDNDYIFVQLIRDELYDQFIAGYHGMEDITLNFVETTNPNVAIVLNSLSQLIGTISALNCGIVYNQVIGTA